MPTTALVDNVQERGAAVVSQKLLEFCHLLRAHAMTVTAGRIIEAFRALQVIDMFQRDDFYTVLEATLISRIEDRDLFRHLFQQFWSGPTWAMIPDPCLPAWEDGCAPPLPPSPVMHLAPWEPGPQETAAKPTHSVAMYSPQERLTHKDFGHMAAQELLRVRRLILTMARQMATRLSRRHQAGRKAHLVDPHRTMRQSLRTGGELLECVRRGPKLGKTKMVVLCDVSGSMDVYSRLLLQFLYGLQNGLRGVETLVFSTRVTRITPLLRRRHIDTALALLSDTVRDWSGGTKIGACLQAFNATLAPRLVTSKTLVIIMSDGWDTGDTAVLDTAMAALRHRAFRVIWLNPLLGSPNYQPLCKGMHTALPYVHDFMPVHNVHSLRQFGQLVAHLT